MATLHLFIERDTAGPPISIGGAIADVYTLASPGGQATDRNDIPVSAGTGSPTSVENLPPGNYLVQLRFPSGEKLTKSVRIDADTTIEHLKFRPTESPHEWLSWQSYLGQVTPDITERPPRVLTPTTPQGDTQTPASLLAPSADDLTRIRGIGPKLEFELNRRGVNQIEQVAKLTPRELGWFTQSVKSARSVVSRFDIAQEARSLVTPRPLLAEVAGAPEAKSVDIATPEPARMAMFTMDEDGARLPGSIWPALHEVIRANLPRTCAPGELADRLIRSHPGAQQGATLDSWRTEGSVSVMRMMPGSSEANLQGRRSYGVLHDGVLPWLVALPEPWNTVGTGQETRLLITADQSNPLRSGADVVPQDGDVAALLAFLRRGDSRAAATLLTVARDRLFSKLNNPLAAAAGGLVLVQALRWSGRSRSDYLDRALEGDWRNWLNNLRNWNPWLPDGAILTAWKSLLDNPADLDGPRALLLRAAHGGLPAYTGSFRFLVEGLRAICALRQGGDQGQNNAADIDQQVGPADPDIAEALRWLDLVALRIDMRRVFTTIRLTDRPTSRDFGL